MIDINSFLVRQLQLLIVEFFIIEKYVFLLIFSKKSIKVPKLQCSIMVQSGISYKELYFEKILSFLEVMY